MTSTIELGIVVILGWFGNLVLTVAHDRYLKAQISKGFDKLEKRLGVRQPEHAPQA